MKNRVNLRLHSSIGDIYVLYIISMSEMMIGKNVAIFFQNLLNLGGPELSGIFGLFPISLFYKMKLNKVFENIYKVKFNV